MRRCVGPIPLLVYMLALSAFVHVFFWKWFCFILLKPCAGGNSNRGPQITKQDYLSIIQNGLALTSFVTNIFGPKHGKKVI